MTKQIGILIVSAITLLTVGSLADAAGQGGTARHKAVTIVPVLGQAVDVPPGQFVKAFAFCPKGFYVTGGGAYTGAITEVASSPTKDLRGWFVDGTNSDPLNRTFQHRADAVCVKGGPSLIAGAAMSDRLVRQAEIDFASSHRTVKEGEGP